jgi:hypothetical protein
MDTEKDSLSSDKNKKAEISIKTKTGLAFEVPVEGSLGLLALGYAGLIAWRMKRRDAKLK